MRINGIRGGGLLAMALLLATEGNGQNNETRYRDRVAVPGVRITREYVAQPPPVKAPGTARPAAPRRPASPRAAAAPVARVVPAPLPARTNRLDPDLADTLFRQWNPGAIRDVAFHGYYANPNDESGGAPTRFSAVVSGAGAWRLDVGLPPLHPVSWLFDGSRLWRTQDGLAEEQPGEQLEFCPFLTAVSLGWALQSFRAAGVLDLRDLGGSDPAGSPGRLVEAIHRGLSGEVTPWQTTGDPARDRRYRLRLDGGRLLSLACGPYKYKYDDIVTTSGLAVAGQVTCTRSGEPAWTMSIDPASVHAVAPPPPEFFQPMATEEDRMSSVAAKGEDFSPEKIWQPSLPDRMGGDAPFGVFTGDSAATVNLQNLSLNVIIKLLDYPQRGALGLPVGVTWNSKLWDAEYLCTESTYGPGGADSKSPAMGSIDWFDLKYGGGSENGWKNLADFYYLQLQKEYYDNGGKGLGFQPFGREYKVLKKMYLHMPGGAVHELMEETGDRLVPPYEPDGTPTPLGGRNWESVDSSNIRVRLGDRGAAYDALADGDFLYLAHGQAGIKVLRIADPDNVEEEGAADTPGAAVRLLKAGSTLYVGTVEAGLQLYDVTHPATPARIGKPCLNNGSVAGMALDDTANPQFLYLLLDELGGSRRLYRVDIRQPAHVKIAASCPVLGILPATALPPVDALEAYHDCVYLPQGDGLAVYRAGGNSIGWLGDFHPAATLGHVWTALHRDGGVLYAAVAGQGVMEVDLGTGAGMPVGATLHGLSQFRAGRRLAQHGDCLYILGFFAEGLAGLDRWNRSTGAYCQRTLPRADCPETNGAAADPASGVLCVAGGAAGVAAYTLPAVDGGCDPLARRWVKEPACRDTTVCFPDGSRVVLGPDAQRLQDANGNFVDMTWNSGHVHFRDTLGREFDSPLPAISPLTDNRWIPQDGYGPVPAPVELDLPGYNDPANRYTLTYAPLSSQTAIALSGGFNGMTADPGEYPCLPGAEFLFFGSLWRRINTVGCFNPLVLSAIALPNGQKYEFTYNAWGEMVKIVYPTGGYERFEFGPVPFVSPQGVNLFMLQANRGVVRRYASAKGDGTDECVTVYGTRVVHEGAVPPTDYSRVIRTVEFYADAAQADLPGSVPDSREERHFFMDGYLDPVSQAFHDKDRHYAWGLEHYLSGKEFEVRRYLKDPQSGQFHLHEQVLRGYASGVYDPALTIRHPYYWDIQLGWRNPLETETVSFLCNDSGQPRLAARVASTYYRNNLESYFDYCNLKDRSGYDFVDVNLAGPVAYNPRDGLAALAAQYFGGATPLRREEFTYIDGTDYLVVNLTSLPESAVTREGDGTMVKRTVFGYDGQSLAEPPAVTGWAPPVTPEGAPTAARGNLTSGFYWVADGADLLSDVRHYDQYGNLVDYCSPGGRMTTWEHAVDYDCAYVTAQVRHPQDSCLRGMSLNRGLLSPTTLLGRTSASSQLAITPSLSNCGAPVSPRDDGLRTAYEYEPVTGRLTRAYDVNHDPGEGIEVYTDFAYEPHKLHRLIGVTEPNGRETSITYDDSGRIVTVQSDQAAIHGQEQETARYFDGLGRPVEESVKVNVAGEQRWTKRTYDRQGRPEMVYNPSSTQGGTAWHTTTIYDSLDRPVRVTNPDDTYRTTVYELNRETVADEAGHWKEYTRDALGRIVEVEEPGDLRTEYAWRATGELLTVAQGVQTRSFAYDGLGRLRSAEYPEIDFAKTWEYDPDGLVIREAMGPWMDGSTSYPDTWLEYGYDGLGRVTAKTEMAETEDGVSHQFSVYNYVYDGGDGGEPEEVGGDARTDGYPRGRLTSKTGISWSDANWSEGYTYDIGGRVTGKTFHQRQDYSSGYNYNLAGQLVGVTYPSGKTVAYVPDLEGKPTAVPGLVDTIAYAVHGGVNQVAVPFARNGRGRTLEYQRLYDPATLRVSGIDFPDAAQTHFGYTYKPDGNIQAIVHTGFAGVDAETFTYDSLDRLTQVSYPILGDIGYAYDRYGNLLQRQVSVPEAATTDRSFNYNSLAAGIAATNRLPAEAGFIYDARGNLARIEDPLTHVVREQFTYDLENRLIEYQRPEYNDPVTGDPLSSSGLYWYNDGFQRIGADSQVWLRDLDGGGRFSLDHRYHLKHLYLYDPAGEVLTELTTPVGTKNGLVGGGTSARPAANGKANEAEPSVFDWLDDSREDEYSVEAVKYQFTDHLGSTRAMAGVTWRRNEEFANLSPEVDQFDYDDGIVVAETMTPYGGWLHPGLPAPGSALDFPGYLVDTDPLHFTGKPKDIESGLTFFGARYYSDQLCRWVSPDAQILPSSKARMNAFVTDPRHWNLYTYTLDNPILYLDLDGFAEIRFHLYALSAANYGPEEFERYLRGGTVAGTTSDRFEFMGHHATFFKDKRTGMSDFSKSLSVRDAMVIMYSHTAFEKGTGKILGLLDTATPGKLGLSNEKIGGLLRGSTAAVVLLAACSSSQFAANSGGQATVVGLFSANTTSSENIVSQAIGAFVDTLVGIDANGNIVNGRPGTVQEAVNAANVVFNKYKSKDRLQIVQGDPNRRLP